MIQAWAARPCICGATSARRVDRGAEMAQLFGNRTCHVAAPDGPHNFTNQAQLAGAADLQMPPSPETAATGRRSARAPGVDVMGVIGGPVFGQTRTVRMTEEPRPKLADALGVVFEHQGPLPHPIEDAGRIDATNSPEPVKQRPLPGREGPPAPIDRTLTRRRQMHGTDGSPSATLDLSVLLHLRNRLPLILRR